MKRYEKVQVLHTIILKIKQIEPVVLEDISEGQVIIEETMVNDVPLQ